MEFGKTKDYKILSTIPKPGSFATLTNPYKWESCRDRFVPRFKEHHKGFYFSHRTNAENVASFIQKTEDILGFPEKLLPYSTFNRTTCSIVTQVNASEFWRTSKMKRSLFTILVRSSNAYNISQDNYEMALFSHKHADETRPACWRFLFGFTELSDVALEEEKDYKHVNDGWHATFRRKSEKEVRKRLVRPVEEQGVNLFCINSLWV